MIYLVFDKIAASALGYEIDLKVIVAVLTHSMPAHTLDIAISVVEKFPLAIYVFVFHKSHPFLTQKCFVIINIITKHQKSQENIGK